MFLSSSSFFQLDFGENGQIKSQNLLKRYNLELVYTLSSGYLALFNFFQMFSSVQCKRYFYY